jgi:uncharacterized protein YrrD
MADLPAELQQHLLLGTPVYDGRTGQSYGSVAQLWMDPRRHRVLGLICRQGQWGSRFSVFKLDQLQAIAPDSLTVTGEPAQPDPRRLQSLPSLLGLPVWTDTGEFLGKIADCGFATASGRIRCYVLRGSGWRRLVVGRYELPPTAIRNWTPGRITVSAAAAEQLKLVQPGLKDAVHEWGDRLQSQYKQQLDQLQSQAQTWREEAQEVGDRARHWLEEVQLEGPGFVDALRQDWEEEHVTAQRPQPDAAGGADEEHLGGLEDWDDFEDLWSEPEAVPLTPRSDPPTASSPEPQPAELPPLPQLERKPRSQAPLIPPEDLESADPWI